MSKPLIKVEGLKKKFCQSLSHAIGYGLKDLISEFAGSAKTGRNLRDHEFWSLNDINLEVHRGQCVGLIGPNGAGKTTLLRLLCGLSKPDHGKITIRGKIGSLIGLGVGFNTALTGRENVFTNGVILGLSRRQINQRLDSIIRFSELKGVMDSPVQNYSSGMLLRLGFAIAIHMESDILLVDQYLGVGDTAFRLKCYEAIQTLAPRMSVIVVSHTMQQIAKMCNAVMVLNAGNQIYSGEDVFRGVQLYYSMMNTRLGLLASSDEAMIRNVKFFQTENFAPAGKKIVLQFDLALKAAPKGARITVKFSNQWLNDIWICDSAWDGVTVGGSEGYRTFEVEFDTNFFINMLYFLNVIVTDSADGRLLVHHRSIRFPEFSLGSIERQAIRLKGVWRSGPTSGHSQSDQALLSERY